MKEKMSALVQVILRPVTVALGTLAYFCIHQDLGIVSAWRLCTQDPLFTSRWVIAPREATPGAHQALRNPSVHPKGTDPS